MPSKRTALAGLLVVVIVAALGAVAGVAWWAWWKPAPVGQVYAHHPFFLPDEEFRSTGLYVGIATAVGLVTGVVGSVLLRRSPLFSVVSLVLGAVAGAAAMILTGWLLGPESAVALARHAKDGASVHAALRVQPGAAWCAMPFATAVGCLGVLLSHDRGEHGGQSLHVG
ncbi:hypothetical protein [Nocardioides jiangxiensis]|uniref:DUF2567 domain-containing protein n=1 Tax=Nocardioides jiangxiensis TaxID=3064524 RepID=A0ABT9B3C9_9ACTN|nr:hypothetical protein [Nocardioides sp. WY-20]MDO7869360.1 hypothetical protein [Nocardioides sp. WY-20]